MRPLARHWAALLALALFLIAGLAVLDDYGVTADEPWQRSIGLDSLRYLRGDWDALPNDHNKFYGIAFEAPLLFIERAFGLQVDRDVHLARHLLTHLTLLIGGLFAYMLAHRLFGSRPLAVAAMLLFLLHPRLYAHSFFNSKDIPFLVMFMVALFLTHWAFKRDGVAAFALLGAAVGLLINLRVMGVVLPAAVLALRALDLAFAQEWAERKRILVTTGVFALAGALTIYAILPYLWSDPIGRAAEWWATLSNHPNKPTDLFRGTLYRSDDFPIEYLPVWFSISSPPFALLLGAAGAGCVLLRGARSPRKALRSGGLRFALLLVACFALPALAVMLPGGNIYNGWRQMYFLWAPFALLAVFGLHRLAGALGARARMAVYGAAGAGFAATVISMALIHPNEDVYFNLLTDRVAPGHLRSQYPVAYWDHTIRQGLEWVVMRSAQSSGGPSPTTANGPFWVIENALVLPESARERLASAAPFATVPGQPVVMSWGRSARELHRVEVYANALMVVESRDDLRSVYEAVRGRVPAMAGAFDVHRLDGALALVMEPCAPAFVERRGWLTVNAFPVDPVDLPPWRRGETFEPRSFWLADYGAFFDGKCVASLPLPAYPVSDFEVVWSPELLAAGDAREKARRAQEQGRLLASVEYDVYLADGELAYLREACDPLETEQPFELFVYPEQTEDLPESLREQGRERFDIDFHRYGAFVDGGCVAFFPLPDYPIASIRTGQSIEGGGEWRAGFAFNAEPYRAAYQAAVSGEPLARSAFDVYLSDGALVYAKEPCEQGDTAAKVFLHITPEQVADLPEERRGSGFANLDFDFFSNGALFDGKCAARVRLPDYAIASIRTGQFVGGEEWRAGFALNAEPYRAAYQAAVSGEPLARSAFDVHMADGALVYIKEPCAQADVQARFFLHITPERVGDLPEERRAGGFDNLDFDFLPNGALFDGRCAARVPLPEYAVASARTGQFAEGREVWSADFEVGR